MNNIIDMRRFFEVTMQINIECGSDLDTHNQDTIILYGVELNQIADVLPLFPTAKPPNTSI